MESPAVVMETFIGSTALPRLGSPPVRKVHQDATPAEAIPPDGDWCIFNMVYHAWYPSGSCHRWRGDVSAGAISMIMVGLQYSISSSLFSCVYKSFLVQPTLVSSRMSFIFLCSTFSLPSINLKSRL
jgi:hypothetical protein